MYEKATLADLAIVAGILLIGAGLTTILASWGSVDFFIIIGAGIGLVVAGFILDRIYETRKRQVDLEAMQPKLITYIEDSERLIQSGGKALGKQKSKKSLDIYLAAMSTLEMAEQVARQGNDQDKLELIQRDLTETRTGIGRSKVAIAADMSDSAEQLYLRGKYAKALEICTEARELLQGTSGFLNVDTEISKIDDNILNCRKRIGELEMESVMKEVKEREAYFKEYFNKGLLFDARDMLNIMEVKVQRASGIAEEFGFATAMGDINRNLIMVREGKTKVEKAILNRLRSRDTKGPEITTIVDKIDPTLRKVAVDTLNKVEVCSGYDFRNGAVRVQFTVTNERSSVITNLTLKVLRDERLLNLLRVIPDYEVRFNEVVLGTFEPDEKKTVNFYFDPQVCGEITIDSTVTYLDPSGNYETLIPERKTIEIPKPVIRSEKNVNSNYLTILMDQARAVGVRSFHVPADLDLPMAFNIIEQVVQSTGLTPIWSGGTMQLSAGYYGKCDGEECGLRISCRDRVFEITAAGGSKESITYLLTSISGTLRERLEKAGHRGVNIALTIKDSIIHKSTIALESAEPAHRVKMPVNSGGEWSDDESWDEGDVPIDVRSLSGMDIPTARAISDQSDEEMIEIVEEGEQVPRSRKNAVSSPNY